MECDNIYDYIVNSSNKELKQYEINSIGDDFEHITYKIKSVEEFIKVINELQKLNEEEWKIVYRGQGRVDYKLIPRLARGDYNIEWAENNMIQEFINNKPSHFNHCKSNFELLAEMQHYGLPTRLLDFTFNPLVALFFACDGDFDDDGRVILNATSSSSDSIKIAEHICSIINIECYSNMSIGEIVPQNSILAYFSELYMDDNISNKIVVQPKYWNLRQEHQQSVFMVFENKLQMKKSWYEKFELSKDKDIKCCIKSIFNKEAGDMQKLKMELEQAFIIEDEIADISKKNIKDHFVSIIIDSNCKVEILEQLKRIGISKSFIYPELEYMASEIADKYRWI